MYKSQNCLKYAAGEEGSKQFRTDREGYAFLTTMKKRIDTLVANYNRVDMGISDYTGAVKKKWNGYK